MYPLVINDLTKDHIRHRAHHEVTRVVEANHFPCATTVANADTSPKIAEVRLTRNPLKLSSSYQQQREQTEPHTEMELADGSPVQEAADLAPTVETRRGKGVA